MQDLQPNTWKLHDINKEFLWKPQIEEYSTFMNWNVDYLSNINLSNSFIDLIQSSLEFKLSVCVCMKKLRSCFYYVYGNTKKEAGQRQSQGRNLEDLYYQNQDCINYYN